MRIELVEGLRRFQFSEKLGCAVGFALDVCVL